MTPPLAVRLRWAYFDGTKHTAVVIASPPNDQERDLPDLLWAYTWTTQHPTGDQAATSHGLARLFNTKDLRPAIVGFEGNGAVSILYRDNTELSPQDVCFGPDHVHAAACSSLDMKKQTNKMQTKMRPKGRDILVAEPPSTPPPAP